MLYGGSKVGPSSSLSSSSLQRLIQELDADAKGLLLALTPPLLAHPCSGESS